MKGLDATVLKSSELLADNEPFRLDSEFHRKECRAAIDTVRAAGAEQFKDSLPKIIHPHEIVREYVEDDGVWFFRAQNLRPLVIDESNKVFVSRKDADSLGHNRLNFGDVLITRTGANRGDCAYFDSREEAVASSHTFIVRSEQWNHAFLAAFFNSSYGKLQIDKGVYGAAQPEVAPYFLRRIWIPKVSGRFQQAIADVFDIAAKERNKTLTLAKQAEECLLTALGLGDWRPPEPLTYTRRASDVFTAKRYDAEYFDPSSTVIGDHLVKYGARHLADFAEVGTGFPWDSEHFIEDRTQPGEPFVRIRDCKPGTLGPEDLDKLAPEYANAQGQPRAKVGDLVLGMDGLKWFYASLLTGPCYINQRVAHLRVAERPEFSSEFLLTAINSILGQRQLLRAMTIAHTVGHITLNDIRRLLIPNVPRKTHDSITAKVQSMHTARARARELLDRAKLAVEIAIEKDEKAALESLRE